MKFKIGFADETERETVEMVPEVREEKIPVRSLVQVFFSANNKTLTYYNDQFDLHEGDLVYVEGALEGVRGCVKSVNYGFKIKRSDYKRIIAVVKTEVKGTFYGAGSHMITFDPGALPCETALLWYKPPADEEEFEEGSDGTSFPLDEFPAWGMEQQVMNRGREYYIENRVRYLCLEGERGHAIVEGTDIYEVEFLFRNGEISRLVCDCCCPYRCKHEAAALMQLREVLSFALDRCAGEYAGTGYLAAVFTPALFAYGVDGKIGQKLILE